MNSAFTPPAMSPAVRPRSSSPTPRPPISPRPNAITFGPMSSKWRTRSSTNFISGSRPATTSTTSTARHGSIITCSTSSPPISTLSSGAPISPKIVAANSSPAQFGTSIAPSVRRPTSPPPPPTCGAFQEQWTSGESVGGVPSPATPNSCRIGSTAGNRSAKASCPTPASSRSPTPSRQRSVPRPSLATPPSGRKPRLNMSPDSPAASRP